MAYEQQQTRKSGVKGWSRTRWLVLAAVVIAIAVAGLLVSMGGHSGGGGGGWG